MLLIKNRTRPNCHPKHENFMMKVMLYYEIEIQIQITFDLINKKHPKKNIFGLWEGVDILYFTCCFCNLRFISKFYVLANEMLGVEYESAGLGV
jgi:hypothetical protein